MKKFLNSAFTMAEAILVMTILGIIATIMISTLKPAEFKEKGMQVMAKKVLSEIDVATTQILINNTADGTLKTIYEVGTSNMINGIECDQIEGSRVLSGLYKAYLTTLRKEPTQNASFVNAFLLKDGAAIGITFHGLGITYPEGMDTIFPGETELTKIYSSTGTSADVDIMGYIWFDINDNEQPNINGKDRFIIPLGPNGILYAQ